MESGERDPTWGKKCRRMGLDMALSFPLGIILDSDKKIPPSPMRTIMIPYLVILLVYGVQLILSVEVVPKHSLARSTVLTNEN